MHNYILAGCDLHDKTLLLKVAVNQGKPQVMVFSNTSGGRKKMIRTLKKMQQEIGAEAIHLAYEASGQGFGLHDELMDAGIRYSVLAPSHLPHSGKSRKAKTDEKDAQRVLEVLRGHVLAGNKLPSVWIPDAQTRDDREVVRARLDVGEKRTATRTQIQSLLKRNKVVKPKNCGKSWTNGHRAWLYSLLKESSELEFGTRSGLASLLRQLESLEDEIDHLDRAIRMLSTTDRYREMVTELCELVGVGVFTAITFLTELGDPSRFNNRRQVGAYFGLCPSSHESGEASDRKGHITRQGSGRVRFVLCQAMWSRVRHDADDGIWYANVVARNPKHKKIALVGGMRRLAVRMWHRAVSVHQRRQSRGDTIQSQALSSTA